MNSLDQRWSRLVTVARGAAASVSAESAPLGFSTRVTALWATSGESGRRSFAWAHMAFSGCGVAVLLAIMAIVTWGPSLQHSGTSAELVALADPLSSETTLP